MLQNQTKSVVLYVCLKGRKLLKLTFSKNISGDIGYKIVCQKWTKTVVSEQLRSFPFIIVYNPKHLKKKKIYKI